MGTVALLTGVLRRGNPLLGLMFTLICHISITVVNELVEQPAVREMYQSAAPQQPGGAGEGHGRRFRGSRVGGARVMRWDET
jgi:hypothetical protein